MCGILLTIDYRHEDESNLLHSVKDELCERINDRGPSWSNIFCVVLDNCKLTFVSSVLSLRRPFTKQPVVSDIGVLQFNGELYNSDITSCDTRYFMESIEKFGVAKTVANVVGEYTFVFYEKDTDLIWYARDTIGRRSLVQGNFQSSDNYFISSISPDPRFDLPGFKVEEVPSKGLFLFDLKAKQWKTFAYWGTRSDKLSIENQRVIKLPFRTLSPLNCNEDGIVSMKELEQCSLDLEAHLELAVRRRVLNIPEYRVDRADDKIEKTIAILFSGGIDCTLLAYFADKVLPEDISIDLLNVSFENLRKKEGWTTPDRALGHRSWLELEECRKIRNGLSKNEPRFRFVEINVPYKEMTQHRPFVQRLMWPKNGVMDLSIAIAFYFASRGKGTAIDIEGTRIENYTSSSRVLLSGLGADELFAGYSRHIGCLQRNGYSELAQELELDFGRLDQRNLGRDDRVCSTWGKEMRYPFLDERVVDWAMICPLNGKLFIEDMNDKKPIIHTKYLLRLIAKRVGLCQVSKELKRAIQFGARSAKMEIDSGKLKGHDVLAFPPNT